MHSSRGAALRALVLPTGTLLNNGDLQKQSRVALREVVYVVGSQIDQVHAHAPGALAHWTLRLRRPTWR